MTKKQRRRIKAGEGANSTQNGKQTPYWVVGGLGMKPHQDSHTWKRVGCPWNPGRQRPSKKYNK